MGGINIYCGSFRGEDKSGTAFEDVLSLLRTDASSEVVAAIAQIELMLEDAVDHILLPPTLASVLLPSLQAIAVDVAEEIVIDCVNDFKKACAVSIAEGEPIAFVW